MTLTAQEAAEIALDWGLCRKIADRIRYCDGIRPEDGEDFAQDVLLEMIVRARRDDGNLSVSEMWRAARCVRSRYWRAYKRGRSVLSLNMVIQATERPIELWETLEGKNIDLDAWLEARLRLGELPGGVLLIAKKLERGDPLTPNQRALLIRFRKDGKPTAQEVRARNLYRSRRSQGLCVRCGEENRDSTLCPRCREVRRVDRWRRRRRNKTWQRTLRAHWKKQGRCTRCGAVPEPGRKRCSSCHAKDREHLRRWRKARAEAEARAPKQLVFPGQKG
ncbi:hypothetical protein LCGC14_2694430 [marine sediment metagenome]|uniref:Uncharacterized protein n=1 Tax=marine sediment metagenome TaxID=412755 RepID=A0A0F8ZHI2_9ZZZZ